MIVTYSPEGSEPRKWDFDPSRVRVARAEMIEKRFGGDTPSYDFWLANVNIGSARALRVLLWHLLSLDHPTLRLEDVDPYRGEIETHFSIAELERLRDEISKRRARTAEEKAEREEKVATLDAEIESRKAEECAAAPSDPTTPSES